MKTRWMFHIFGYDASALTYLNTHIANNYLRGYITADGYLLGYLLLLNDQQNGYDILGSFSYIWRMDCMLLNRIHRHLGSVIFAFDTTLTTTLNHNTCINTFGEGFKKTLFAINALFTKDNNLSKTKVGGLCRKQSLHARNVKRT